MSQASFIIQHLLPSAQLDSCLRVCVVYGACFHMCVNPGCNVLSASDWFRAHSLAALGAVIAAVSLT